MPPDGNLITLGTVAAGLLGTLAWVLRSALPAMLKQHREDILGLHEECAREREATQKRHDEEIARRDAAFAAALEKTRCRAADRTELVELRAKKPDQ